MEVIVAVITECVSGRAPGTELQMLYTEELLITCFGQNSITQRSAASPRVNPLVVLALQRQPTSSRSGHTSTGYCDTINRSTQHNAQAGMATCSDLETPGVGTEPWTPQMCFNSKRKMQVRCTQWSFILRQLKPEPQSFSTQRLCPVG